jgi:hypothetical protein
VLFVARQAVVVAARPDTKAYKRYANGDQDVRGGESDCPGRIDLRGVNEEYSHDCKGNAGNNFAIDAFHLCEEFQFTVY